jgi:hypothetical protein
MCGVGKAVDTAVNHYVGNIQEDQDIDMAKGEGQPLTAPPDAAGLTTCSTTCYLTPEQKATCLKGAIWGATALFGVSAIGGIIVGACTDRITEDKSLQRTLLVVAFGLTSFGVVGELTLWSSIRRAYHAAVFGD